MINWTMENVIAFAVLILTFLGVCIAIIQTVINTKTSLKLNFNYHFLFNQLTAQRVGTMVCLKVVNTGSKNITIEGWGVKLNKSMHSFLQTGAVIGDKLPSTLHPSEDVNLFLPVEDLQKFLHKNLDDGKINEKTKITLFVYDNQGKEYYLKTEVNIKNVDNFAKI